MSRIVSHELFRSRFSVIRCYVVLSVSREKDIRCGYVSCRNRESLNLLLFCHQSVELGIEMAKLFVLGGAVGGLRSLLFSAIA